MKKWIILSVVLFASASFSDDDDSPPHINPGSATPNILISGLVDPVSGAVIKSYQDHVIPGPIPLPINRSLVSVGASTRKAFYFLTPEFLSHFGEQLSEVHYKPGFYKSDGWGSCSSYISPECNSIYKMALAKGTTNFHKGILSARTNRKNGKFQGMTFIRPDKTCALYADIPKADYRPIQKETTPSGHSIEYEYGDYEKSRRHKDFKKPAKTLVGKFVYSMGHAGRKIKKVLLPYGDDFKRGSYLKKMTLKSPSGKELSWISLEYPEYAQSAPFEETRRDVIVRTSDSRQFVYKMQEGWDDLERGVDYLSQLIGVEGIDAPLEEYEYSDFSTIERKYNKDRLSKISWPGGSLQVNYQGERADQVYELIAPTRAIDNAPHPIATITYHISSESPEGGKSGYTKSYDANNNRTDYHYTGNRINQVHHFRQDGSRDSMELFYWGSGKDETNLITLATADGSGKAILAKHYSYDAFGNVLKERLYGNLTGTKIAFVALDASGMPKSSNSEFCETSYAYTEDHLCAEKIEQTGKKTTYTYKPGTNLLLSQIVHLENGKRRTFYEYDADHVLVGIIEDDGSSENFAHDLSNATFRKSVQIKPRQKQPALGMPEEKSVYFWDPKTNKNRLSKREVFFYNTRHKLIQKDIYDANNQHQITLHWTYDDKSRCTSETNALGFTTRYTYDANNNVVKIALPNGLEKTFEYNPMNRLISEKAHAPLEVKEKRYQYDSFGNKTAYWEFVNGKCTAHSVWAYDHRNRPIREGTASLEGRDAKPVHCFEHCSYDILGNVIVRYAPNSSSENGDISDKSPVTKTTYTIRGSPCHRVYPDGAEERFIYNLDGSLKAHRKTDKTLKTFSYDLLGNVICEKVEDASGKLVSESKATYDAFGKITSKTDAMGVKTLYEYDTFGRLFSEFVEGTGGRIEYGYNALGQRESTCYFEKNSLQYIEKVSYDLLGRAVSSATLLPSGNTQEKEDLAYDSMGNIIKKTAYGKRGLEETFIEYDLFGRARKVQDPIGAKTSIDYHLIDLGRWDFWYIAKVTTDPLGRKSEVVFDSHGNPKDEKRYDALGALIFHNTKIYDSRDNLTFEQQKDPKTGRILFEVAYTYNLVDNLVEMTEGYKSQSEKKVHFIYNDLGLLIKKIKPNGSTCYEHSKEGLISRVYSEGSSDDAIDYTYSHDPLGRVVKAVDSSGQILLNRFYDAYGNLSQDTYGGLTISHTYSSLGRKLSTKLPDSSSIFYTYEGAHLKKSFYKNTSTEIVERDLSGRICCVRLPYNLGFIKKSIDPLGNLIKIEAPYFSEQNTFDRAGRLITKTVKDPLGKNQIHYHYDDLDQLISEEGVKPHTYTYDTIQNRISHNENTFQITKLNQIGSSEDLDIEYDSWGNLIRKTSDKELKFSYDAFDRLIGIVSPGKFSYTFSYDPLDRRITEIHDGKKRTFIYDEECEIGSVDTHGKVEELRVPLEGIEAEIANGHHFIIEGEDYVPIYDHRGNVTLLLSGYYQKPSMAYRYTGFGERTSLDVAYRDAWVSLSSPRKNVSPWLFSSKRYIPGAAITAFGARDYDPKLGRWMSPDPLGYADGMNLYAYVHNSPIMHYDAFGLLGSDARSEQYHIDSLREMGQDFSNSNVGSSLASAAKDVSDFARSSWDGFCSRPFNSGIEGHRVDSLLGGFENQLNSSGGLFVGVPNAQGYLSEENASLSETGYVYGSVASEALEACAQMGEVAWTLCTLGSGSLLTNTVRTTYFCGKSYIRDKFREFVSRNRSTSVIRSPRLAKNLSNKNASSLKYADLKFSEQLSRNLAKNGPSSIRKSYKSLKKNLVEHKNKLGDVKYKSSIEREIRTFKKQIETVQKFAKQNNIDLK